MNRELILICEADEHRARDLSVLCEALGYQGHVAELRSMPPSSLPLPILILIGDVRNRRGAPVSPEALARRFPGVPMVDAGAAAFGHGIEEMREHLLELVDENLAQYLQPPVGVSGAMQSLRAAIDDLAASAMPVLITGEAGSGRREVAQCIHERSRRCGGPFVSLNCLTVPRELLALHLFGQHARPSIARLARRTGKFDQAEGGTLFLGEIEALPTDTQLSLLQTLDTDTIRRLEGHRRLPVDVRLIVSISGDLPALVEAGRIRKDLAQRLDLFPLRVPALRDRPADVPYLVRVLAGELQRRGWPRIAFSQPAVETLGRYPWPGNVQELAVMIEQLCVKHGNRTVEVEHLPHRIQAYEQDEAVPRIHPAWSPRVVSLPTG